jgi:hypothetical protein
MSEFIEYPAPDLSLVKPPESAWERERRAFRALLPELRVNYDGQYVAIKDGNVVANGSDREGGSGGVFPGWLRPPLSWSCHRLAATASPNPIATPRARPGSLLK